MDQTAPSQGSHTPETQVDVGRDEALSVTRAQTGETVALLRQLIEMLLPKGDAGKPKLEDLIAALVAQQAQTLLLVKRLSVDMASVLKLLGPVHGSGAHRHPKNGSWS